MLPVSNPPFPRLPSDIPVGSRARKWLSVAIVAASTAVGLFAAITAAVKIYAQA